MSECNMDDQNDIDLHSFVVIQKHIIPQSPQISNPRGNTRDHSAIYD